MVDEDCTGEMETLVPELGVRHRSTGRVFSSRLAQRSASRAAPSGHGGSREGFGARLPWGPCLSAKARGCWDRKEFSSRAAYPMWSNSHHMLFSSHH